MLKLLWKLCTLQNHPDDVPHSIPLLLFIICLNFSIVFFLITLASGAIIIGIWRTLLLQFIIISFTYSVLYRRGFTERIVQALSGLLATQTFILALCLVPYILMMSLLPDVTSNFYYYLGLSVCGLLLVIASIWLFVIYTSIFESALELSINTSLIITMGFIVINVIIFGVLHVMKDIL